MKVKETYSAYISEMSDARLKAFIQAQGKTANQRLRELEKQGLETSSAAYRYANRLSADSDSAMTTTKAGELKFNVNTRGKSQSELRHMAATIRGFMQAKTSTTTGVKRATDKAYKTFTANPANKGVSYKDFAESLSISIFENFKQLYGSDQLVELFQKTKGMSQRDIEKTLHKAGFYARTKRKVPPLSRIDDEIDKFRANAKPVPTEDELTSERYGVFGSDDIL